MKYPVIIKITSPVKGLQKHGFRATVIAGYGLTELCEVSGSKSKSRSKMGD